jgi:DNA-binding NtrC family response regulator
LLGVLERRRVVPLGGTKEIELDFKLIAATNKDLEAMVEEGSFRRDLFYRLSGIAFHIPALRSRKEDIPILLNLFMQRAGLVTSDEQLPSELLHHFVEYDWPGNVRELRNKVKRLELMADQIDGRDFAGLANSLFGGSEMAPETGAVSLFDRVEEFERQLLIEAVLAAQGNKSEAARLLGIHEATVRTKLKRYGISLDNDRIAANMQ